MTIEGMVQSVSRDDYFTLGGFHINWVRIGVYLRYGVSLSYKQARNALYRLRDTGFCLHLGGGNYALGVSYARGAIFRRVSLYAAIAGGIYYRKLRLGAD